MATVEASSSSTVTEIPQAPRSPTVRLRLKKPESDKKVKWTSETVDNEHMGKKKSKCCCIYEKPRLFGESSSEDEGDECGHCRGHKKKCFQKKPSDEGSPSDAGGSSADGS